MPADITDHVRRSIPRGYVEGDIVDGVQTYAEIVSATLTGGGDASAAKQDEQTVVLESIEASLVTTDVASSGSQKGIPLMAIVDAVLSAITPADGDWAPVRIDANGAFWVTLATALSHATDGVYIGTNASGGYTALRILDADETEDAIKATAGKLGGFVMTNLHTATVYLKFYNDTVANVTVGTTTPLVTIAIPASSGLVMPLGGPGIDFSAAITVAATLDEADNDATAIPSANLVVGTVFYK